MNGHLHFYLLKSAASSINEPQVKHIIISGEETRRQKDAHVHTHAHTHLLDGLRSIYVDEIHSMF